MYYEDVRMRNSFSFVDGVSVRLIIYRKILLNFSYFFVRLFDGSRFFGRRSDCWGLVCRFLVFSNIFGFFSIECWFIKS